MRTWTTTGGCRITQVLSRRSNVFLLSYGGRNILVDTGRKKFRADLVGCLQGLHIAFLDALVLTHTHFDHAENASFIRKKYNAKVIVHQSEAGFLRSGKSPLPKGTLALTKLVVALFAKKMEPAFDYEQCSPDLLMEDGLDLSDFGFAARLLHTPGHSRGSISVIVDNEMALVGDLMFGSFPHTIFPPFADNIPQLVSSWGRLLGTPCSLFMPGHGSPRDRKRVQKAYAGRIGVSS